MGRFPVITLSPGIAEASAGVALSTADAEGQVTLMKTAEDLLIGGSWFLYEILTCVTNVQVSVLNLSASIGLESQNGGLPHSGYSIYTKLRYLVVTNNK